MNAPRRFRWVLLLGMLGMATTALMATEPADQIVSEIQKALGKEKLDQARFIRFDYEVKIPGHPHYYSRHLWDRTNDRYRVEWRTPNGKKIVAFFTPRGQRGQAYEDGLRAPPEDEERILAAAYQRYINDSYWLLAPFKLTDPGVHVEIVDEHMNRDETADVLHVHFDDVGLTPKDQYWMFFDKKLHRLDRWAFFLQSFKGKPSLEKAANWIWDKWENVHGVWLAHDRIPFGKAGSISFPILALPDSVPENIFLDPNIPLR